MTACLCTRYCEIQRQNINAKGIPGRQRGIYKGIEARKGVGRTAKLGDTKCKVHTQFGQTEEKKVREGTRVIVIIHIFEELDLLYVRGQMQISQILFS